MVVSATHRESLRVLIAKVAQTLAERWDKSAKVPEPADVEVSEDGEGDRGSADAAVTVEEMLRAAGKRVRTRTRETVPPG